MKNNSDRKQFVKTEREKKVDELIGLANMATFAGNDALADMAMKQANDELIKIRYPDEEE